VGKGGKGTQIVIRAKRIQGSFQLQMKTKKKGEVVNLKVLKTKEKILQEGVENAGG